MGQHVCHLCSSSFVNKSNYNRHFVQFHQVSSNPLYDIEQMWKQIPVWHPQLHNGLSIFKFLEDRNVRIQQPMGSDSRQFFELEPTHFHIVQDVLSTPFSGDRAPGSLISTTSCLLAPQLSVGHLFATLHAVDSKNLGALPLSQLCGASGVQPSTNGLLSCIPKTPSFIEDFGILPYNKPDGSFAYTASGHITDIHQDSLYQGRVFTVLHGTKLFLTAPPTHHNLHEYGHYHAQGTGMVLPLMLPRLEQLSATVYNHGSYGYLPPGTLHAVITLKSAATFAYDIIFSDILEVIPNLVRWELQIARDLMLLGDLVVSVPSIIEDHDVGLLDSFVAAPRSSTQL
ncbi:hypothetical protein OC845_004424 [Tilletia horrida]|nr:hypothetical protein OC845_004424 [Tilletia horrida]